ncbi:Plant peroxidase [Corchorus capsularis]|uniref:Peroxidase n=1 Tax=Corchorus capsularis TaxID=210143 RepID=A0A1R3H146_COCAP|nr:Plant peroxidase [Corchorus capsularis]
MSSSGSKLLTLAMLCFIIFLCPLFSTDLASAAVASPLKVGFYKESCPSAETIVRKSVEKAMSRDATIAAGIIRMYFHDCFIKGCDASVLLDSPTAERTSKANNGSLRGLEVIDEAKAQIEAQCPATVSCADIIAFAARDSAYTAGGIYYAVPAGRRDGLFSSVNDVFPNLPGPDHNVTILAEKFANKGMSVDEMVTLSGAHAIGVAHCPTFSKRLYNFSATHAQDPSLDPDYAELLKMRCPPGATTMVPLSDLAPQNRLDNKYYAGVRKGLGLFTSDQTLMDSSLTSKMVADNEKDGASWGRKFAKAMVHLGSLDVLTGEIGEIRTICSKVAPGQ